MGKDHKDNKKMAKIVIIEEGKILKRKKLLVVTLNQNSYFNIYKSVVDSVVVLNENKIMTFS